jgi:ribosomal-protein-alanine N-acetyltransferase
MTELSTARLRLVPFRIEDAAELFEIRGDPEAMAYWDWPADERLGQTIAVARSLLEDVRAGRAMIWTVRLAADQTFVGLCDLSELDGSGTADLGFMFARKVWGRGYAREAVESILTAAPSLGTHRVAARVHADNVRSRHLLVRLGFSEGAVLEGFEIRPGVHKTCLRFERAFAAPQPQIA